MHTNRKSSSSSSSEERLPRRSNSFGGHNKRSLVASLTHVIPTNKQSSLDLSSSSAPASEIPYIAQDSNAEIHDLALFRPSYGGVNISAVWENCTMRGWMTKHIPPSYSFTKTKKQRYVILADRMLYTFKTETPTSHYREFFELTKDTSVFVTDYITGVMYCIEVTKLAGEKKSWYLQCETAEHMKMWLDRLKKTVAWLRDDKLRKRVVTSRDLARIQSEHDALVNNVVVITTTAAAATTIHGEGTAAAAALSPSASSFSVPPISPISTTAPRISTAMTMTTNGTLAGSSSSSESIVSSSSSPLRTSSYYDGSMTDRCSMPDHQDLYYADQYEWDNASVNSRMSVPPSHHHPHQTSSSAPLHPSSIPPQQPPPRSAPPPPPISSSSTTAMHFQKFEF